MKKKVAFNEVDNDVMITFWQIDKDGNYTIERLKDKKVIQSLDFCDFQEAKTFYENLLLLENSTKDWVSIFKQMHNLSFFKNDSHNYETDDVVYFEDDYRPEWRVKIDAKRKVISIRELSKRSNGEKEKEMAKYLLRYISEWGILGLKNVGLKDSKYIFDKIKISLNDNFDFFYSKVDNN